MSIWSAISSFFNERRIEEGALTPLRGPTGPPPVPKLVPLRPVTDEPKDSQKA